MLRVVVVGVCGRMGSEVTKLISAQPDIQVAGGVEAAGHQLLGTPIGSGFVTAQLEAVIGQADVVVDFSVPDAVLENIRLCQEKEKPFITGVTGFSEAQHQELRSAGEKIPVVFAPNFSLGVAVLVKLAKQAVRLLGDSYDINIIETHHRRKKDAPSGTARLLAGAIQEETENRHIPISSIRTGDVVGEHTIIFGGPGERIELIHKAESRVAFAYGVITAIRWIVKQKPGFYSMAHILGID